mmetsp:Transcript_14235/g.18650  ORF Transcript_14235/g.18650 Transcript_14235/m.18650 type:complete len:82 (-) Transcript_14235:740-985(-)
MSKRPWKTSRIEYNLIVSAYCARKSHFRSYYETRLGRKERILDEMDPRNSFYYCPCQNAAENTESNLSQESCFPLLIVNAL